MANLTYYVGAGSRDLPEEIGYRMKRLAERLALRGLILRTGGAPGANSAFAAGVKSAGLRDIYLPWQNFNRKISPFCDPSEASLKMAESYHPAWARLTLSGRKLMACNVEQVLGHDLKTPALFVVTWSPDGAEDYNTTPATGESAQIIRTAFDHGIPIFNLQRGPQRLVELGEFLKKQKIVTELKQDVVERLKVAAEELQRDAEAKSEGSTRDPRHGGERNVDGDDDLDDDLDDDDDEWEDCPDDEFDPDDPEWEYAEAPATPVQEAGRR